MLRFPQMTLVSDLFEAVYSQNFGMKTTSQKMLVTTATIFLIVLGCAHAQISTVSRTRSTLPPNQLQPPIIFQIPVSNCSSGTTAAAYNLQRVCDGDRPRNCGEVQIGGESESGYYEIFPFENDTAVDVWCDLKSEGGGWTLIQQRKPEKDGDEEDFIRRWNDYALGFGDVKSSFWIGLKTISKLTESGNMELRIEMKDWEGEKRVAKYSSFKVGNSTTLYRLSVSGFSGNAGDSLSYHNGMAFSTKDKDNDNHWTKRCAIEYNGGWWFHQCLESNLNGRHYLEDENIRENGIVWKSFHNESYSLKEVRMLLRHKHFNMLMHVAEQLCGKAGLDVNDVEFPKPNPALTERFVTTTPIPTTTACPITTCPTPSCPQPSCPAPVIPQPVCPKPTCPQPSCPTPVIPQPVCPEPKCPQPNCPAPVIPQPNCPKPTCPAPIILQPNCPNPTSPQHSCPPANITNLLPKSCADLQQINMRGNGIFNIFLENASPVVVNCDLITDGGGWTVFQRQEEANAGEEQVDFVNKTWNDYVNGFGDKSGSFWLGLDSISKLTESGNIELRIELEDWEGVKKFAKYAVFKVANASDNYRLQVSGYSGDAGDSFTQTNNMQFTTKDKDNDTWKVGNCAVEFRSGGWWYSFCSLVYLNGRYGKGNSVGSVNWYYFHSDHNYALKRVEMKLRNKTFKA